MNLITNTRPVFSPLVVEDYELYMKYFAKSSYFSDLSFISRIAWSGSWHFLKVEIEDCLIVLYQDRDKIYFASPLGLKSQEQLARIVSILCEQVTKEKFLLCSDGTKIDLSSSERCDALRFLFVEEWQKELFAKIDTHTCEFIVDADYSDYVYDREKLSTYSGKKLHGKRNHYNRFLANHKDAIFAKLEPKHYADCIELSALWTKDNEVKTGKKSSDFEAIKRLLTIGKNLDFIGGTIYEHGKLLAFGIYSQYMPDQAVCHFEKASKEVPEAFTAIASFCARELFPNVKWINREEDLGIMGIRQNKLSYRPAFMLEKTIAILRKK